MPLSNILIEKIQCNGPLSFHDFMEMALYHPVEGYHTCERDHEKFPNQCANPELGSIFGSLLGRQLEEMWNVLDKQPFTIVEYGGGHGTLCNEILDHLKKNTELYEGLHYCIIERSPVMIEKEKQLLQEKVEWYDRIEEVPFPAGCILSNEVLDNFAVHEVVMQKELMEIFIDYRDGFIEILQPANRELKEYLDELQVVLPPGYRTEINMDAIHWLKQNAWALQKGFMLTIDQGFHAAEFFSLSRHRGNLACDQQAEANDSLYHSAGNKDITSHVNFTALHHWGRRFGLECCGYTSQAHFLHGLGLVKSLDTMGDTCKEKFIQLYRHMMSMSSKFNILVQHKGLTRPQLTGLQFAQTYV